MTWAQTAEDNEKLFERTQVPFATTLDAQILKYAPLCFVVKPSIVEKIMGDLLFHPDDNEVVTQQRALSLLYTICDFDGGAELDSDEGTEADDYVMVNNPRRFTLLVDLISFGTSFRMASRLRIFTRDGSGMSLFGGCSDVVASN